MRRKLNDNQEKIFFYLKRMAWAVSVSHFPAIRFIPKFRDATTIGAR